MKNSRLVLLLAMTALTFNTAVAASVTMLQFGSFETRQEAEKRLAEIKIRHADQLADLPSSIREIKLPPDNLTVYRTQAGPVENREAAQGVCAKFASTGDECYIVQTAMLSTDEAVKSGAKNTSTVTVPPASAMLPPVISPVPNGKAKLLEYSAPKTADYSTGITSSMTVLHDAESKVAAAPMLSEELDKAVDAQSVAAGRVDAIAAAEGAARKPVQRSFWSRLNPFDDDAQTVTPEPLPAPANTSELVPATVETVSVTAAPQMVISPAPPAEIAAPIIPPAPASLKEQEKAQEHAAPASSVNAPQSPPLSPVLVDPVVAPRGVKVENSGMVRVEEAKRVPLTQVIVPPVIITSPLVRKTRVSSLQPPVSLAPGSTLGQKTIWTQIGPFADSAAALAFWADYRQSHPDFPVVRVRATTPYQQQLRGLSQSWLRVGPVMRGGFVKSLCSSLPQAAALKCGHVVDLGVAAKPNSALGILSGSRYRR